MWFFASFVGLVFAGMLAELSIRQEKEDRKRRSWRDEDPKDKLFKPSKESDTSELKLFRSRKNKSVDKKIDKNNYNELHQSLNSVLEEDIKYEDIEIKTEESIVVNDEINDVPNELIPDTPSTPDVEFEWIKTDRVPVDAKGESPDKGLEFFIISFMAKNNTEQDISLELQNFKYKTIDGLYDLKKLSNSFSGVQVLKNKKTIPAGKSNKVTVVVCENPEKEITSICYKTVNDTHELKIQ